MLAQYQIHNNVCNPEIKLHSLDFIFFTFVLTFSPYLTYFVFEFNSIRIKTVFYLWSQFVSKIVYLNCLYIRLVFNCTLCNFISIIIVIETHVYIQYVIFMVCTMVCDFSCILYLLKLVFYEYKTFQSSSSYNKMYLFIIFNLLYIYFIFCKSIKWPYKLLCYIRFLYIYYPYIYIPCSLPLLPAQKLPDLFFCYDSKIASVTLCIFCYEFLYWLQKWCSHEI